MPSSLKILLVEDRPADAELILRQLRRSGFDAVGPRVDTEAAFLEQLKTGPDLIISDYAMPEFSGLRALALLKEHSPETPFIIVSGTIGEETAVEAMRQGATDYLLKDRLGRLGPAIAHALEQAKVRRERTRAVEALRTNEEQFRLLTEHIQDVFWSTSPDYQQLHYISPAYETIWGRTVASLRADPEQWIRAIVADDQPRVLAALEELSAGVPFEIEYRIMRPDGTQRWILDRGFPVRTDAGKLLRTVGAARDITEVKRADEIIRQASGTVVRDRRRRASRDLAVLVGATVLVYILAVTFDWFEAVTGWIMAHDAAKVDDIVITAIFFAVGLTVFAVRRWRETESELTGRRQLQAALGLLHEELDRKIAARTHDLAHANKSLRAEVAERQRAEGVVRESERRFREMLGNLELIAMTLDNKGTVTFCNDYLLRLTGWKREEVIGQICFDRFLPEPAAAVQQEFLDSIGAGTIPLHSQKVITTRAGDRREIAWNNTMLRDSAGRITGTASIGEDITERQRADAKIRDQLDELLRWQEVMLNREDRVLALKCEVNDQLVRRGEPPRYTGTAPTP